MSQNSIVINDGTGIEVLTAINAAFDTINTLHAGTTAPTELIVGMLWADTTTNLLKRLASTGPAVWTTLGKIEANLGMLRIDGSNAMTGPLDEASASPATAATLPVTGANFLQATGTTTITALGTAQAGAFRAVRFSGALQITHSANLVLPGATSITTASGDYAEFRSLGGGTWVMTDYKRADGGLNLVGSLDLFAAINEALAADITAASTTNIAGAAGNTVRVTSSSGTINISALGTAKAGARRLAYFSITGGSVTLTHNATSLILPGANNISVTDGDSFEFVSLGSGNWRCTQVQRNSLAARIWTFITKNSSYTVTNSDYGGYFVSTASTPDTFSLPSAASAGAGFVVGIRNKNTNSALLTIAANASDTVEGVSTMNVGIGSSYVLVCDGVNSWYRMDTGISPTTPQAFVNGSQVFGVGVAQTFTVPAGVYYIRVTLWGGGGGGGGVTATTGTKAGGGGSGGFATGIFAVIPSQTYTVTAGAGGTAGTTSGGNGGTGGTSSFGVLLTCTGGGGGVGATAGNTICAGGAAGSASGSGTLINGAAGGASEVSSNAGSGSAAAGISGGALPGGSETLIGSYAPSGSGGAAGGANNSSVGRAGTDVSGTVRESGGAGGGASNLGSGGFGGNGGSPGAGGGGACNLATTARTGGVGGAGKCIVEW